MTGYRLATQETGSGPRAAVIFDDTVYDAASLSGNPAYQWVQSILENWDHAHATFREALANPPCGGLPVSGARFLAPIPRPNVIYCAGANYHDHAQEMSRVTGKPADDPRAEGGRPWFFLKSPHTVAAPDASLHITPFGTDLDWEAELVIVMGRRARNVSVEHALGYVAGYTCGNDLSARELAFRTTSPEGSPFRSDWTSHKSFDDACPMGPWIVPAPYIGNPTDLSIRLWVNDDIKQDSSTSNMIFTPAELISCLSERLTLHPGDTIMTGTPAGVGASRREFLKAGDEIRLEIENIGTIRNLVL